MSACRFRVCTAPLMALASLGALLALGGCSALTEPRTRAQARPLAEQLAPHWQAPLPHDGSLARLDQWWRSWQDPVLAELISAAQRASPTLSSARSQLEQARAARNAAAASLLPTLDASGSGTRGTAQFPRPLNTTRIVGLETAWEADLFDANKFNERAASERLRGTEAQWHDARVSVAAEVALQYIGLRHCVRQLAIAREELASSRQTADLAARAAAAGLLAPQSAALAQAAAADAAARLAQQAAQCEVDIKGLVALTALPEPSLRERLQLAVTPSSPAPWPEPALPALASVPLQVISQRPDVFAAEREIMAARAEVGNAQALRLPRLSLAGSISALGTRLGGDKLNLNAWSIGPLRLRMPLFDGGASQANLQAALARHEDAVTQYEARVRQAVREIEEALVLLDGLSQRERHVREAALAHARALQAVEQRWRAGLAARTEVEEARRAALGSDAAAAMLRHERLTAAVSLYRASGGGWSAQAGTDAAARP